MRGMKRNRLATLYLQQLAGKGDLIYRKIAEGATSVWHLFVIRTEKRDALQQFLTQKGIGTLVHYPIPPHLQRAYRHLGLPKGLFR